MNIETCEKCGGHGQIRDSRILAQGPKHRRRQCVQCDHRWSTAEVLRGSEQDEEPAEYGESFAQSGPVWWNPAPGRR